MGEGFLDGSTDPGVLSRREVFDGSRRGAVVVGAAWVIPEILIATPTGADALSLPTGPGGTTTTTIGDPGRDDDEQYCN